MTSSRRTSARAALVLVAAITGLISCARGPNDGDASSSGLPPSPPCTGRSCKRVACAAGSSTRIRGRVLDPAARRGLHGVSVYVPNAEPAPVNHGATCEPCSKRRRDVAVSAVTNALGEFVLEDAPVDPRTPVVVELGSFRRTAVVDVTACGETIVSDDQVRLPRRPEEGELPRIAATTGAADALECLLRKVGLDDAVFGTSNDPSRAVHMYRGKGGGGRSGLVVPSADTLWNDAEALRRYDAVVLSCEGDNALENKGGSLPGARGSMAAYADAGGHVFATHLHSTWLRDSPVAAYREVATWAETKDSSDAYTIDTSFPKGAAFGAWLSENGASPTLGAIRLDNVTTSLADVRVPPAHAWIRSSAQRARYFSFNAPIGAQRENACGRFVFADLHAFGLGGSDFPDGCSPGVDLTPQQLALEFLLFDLFACVDDDALAPEPPR